MENNIKGIELMGDNLRTQVRYCGEGVRLYPMCKMIHPSNAYLDDCCQIMDFAFIDAGESLIIGKYSTITWHCILEGGAKIKIGDRVFIGPGSKILSSTYELDGYYAIEHIDEAAHSIKYGDIFIEDDVYIGANSIIMPGVTIGEGAIIGAGSFVNKDIEPWGVYVGTPVKRIRKRIKPTDDRRKIIELMNWEKRYPF